MDYFYPLTEANTEIDVVPVELVNVENLEKEIVEIGGFSEEFLTESINSWQKGMKILVDRDISLALMLNTSKTDPHQIIFNTEGLMNEFATLKTFKDIESFSKKYGLLGIKHPDLNHLYSPHPVSQYTKKASYIFHTYGFSVFEPIELWLWHIHEVQKILRLYDVIRNESSEEQIREIIEIKDPFEHDPSDIYFEKIQINKPFNVHWTTGERIFMLPETMRKQSLLEIGQYTLSKILESRLKGGIQISVSDIVRNPLTKSFKVVESRYTQYLLAAIYYDLWQIINDDRNIYKCANKNCGLPFVKTRRKKYCSAACKQEAYRNRKKDEEGRDI
ncbi:hypothetical protein SAMN05444673_0435 [Bacillus sp. OV166]|uniref:CGNR zinc finger domain-containing protein n=1 Tax=Bacillus sp. OV166 TaxID=1882763 RepID=UPI000A2AA562|nr:CGNR zinc finger domain-containing protein [Bacillus sp. OV166]SMQ60886.1 hypothetical protein SAMN05444673_0435 [Bacillus sp. OV166]